MSGILLENIFKTVLAAAGISAAVLQYCGFFQFRAVHRQILKEDHSDSEKKSCRAEILSRPRDEDFMAFLFTIASAYFGWIVLYKSYGFLPVLAVVAMVACLSGYGACQRLQSGLQKITFLSDSQRSRLQRGQIFFCCGIPLLVAAEISLIAVLVFTPEQLDQLVWIRHLTP